MALGGGTNVFLGKYKLLAVAVLVVTLSWAGSSAASGVKAGGGLHTVSIGILTDFTGLGASSNKSSVMGVEAGDVYAATQGYKIKYVVADTATSPTTALTAAQTLVEQDHVLAVIGLSSVTFAAAPYLESQGVPVIGAAEDAGEWSTDKNMFSVYGASHTNFVVTTWGQLLKKLGATSLGTIGYAISPTSAEEAEGLAESARDAGIKTPYVNATFAFGSTNVQPLALGMKSDGINSYYDAVEPSTGFALYTALKQDGVHLKVTMMPTGYGGDLSQLGAGAAQDAKGIYFTSQFEPVEMHTAATEQLAHDLKAVGVTSDPTDHEYTGYLSVALLVQGLKAAGADPTQASLIAALSTIHKWNALGLWGDRTLDINDRTTIASGVGNCAWITQYNGKTFQLVPGADPICGTTVKGQTVSAP